MVNGVSSADKRDRARASIPLRLDQQHRRRGRVRRVVPGLPGSGELSGRRRVGQQLDGQRRGRVGAIGRVFQRRGDDSGVERGVEQRSRRGRRRHWKPRPLFHVAVQPRRSLLCRRQRSSGLPLLRSGSHLQRDNDVCQLSRRRGLRSWTQLLRGVLDRSLSGLRRLYGDVQRGGRSPWLHFGYGLRWRNDVPAIVLQLHGAGYVLVLPRQLHRRNHLRHDAFQGVLLILRAAS